MTAALASPVILLRRLVVLLAAQMSVACAITDGTAVSLQPLFAELTFTRPVAMLQAPGASPYWYVVEKGGRVVRVEGEGPRRSRRCSSISAIGWMRGPPRRGCSAWRFTPILPATARSTSPIPVVHR